MVSARVLSSFVVLASVSAIPAANAADVPAPAPHTMVVSVRDLNLATPHGVATLHHRIERAAKQVCGPVDATIMERLAEYRDCRDAAVAGAMQKADAMVAAAKGGQRVAGDIKLVW